MKKILLLIFFLLLFSLSSVLAYDYPTGIPNAWIEPDMVAPTAPSLWNTEQAGYYYIDNSVSCTDNNNDYGYPANPRCTFPTTITAGSRVEIHGGPYNWTGTVYLTIQGNSNHPVWFLGMPGSEPEFQMNLVIKGTYGYFSNLNFTNNNTISIRPHDNIQTDHILVRNVNIQGTGTDVGGGSGIGISGLDGFLTNDIILFNNEISYCGDYQSVAENDFHGINTGSYVHDIWILDNLTHHNGGDGVQLSHNGVDSHHIYIGRLTDYNEGENAVDIKKANDVIVSDSIFYNYEKRNSSSGVALVIHYDPHNIWVINNKTYNAEWAYMTTGSTNTWFIGNLAYDIKHTGSSWDPDSGYSGGVGIHFRGNSSGGAINNTLDNIDTGIQLTVGNISYRLSNNIITNRTEPTGYDIRVANSAISNITDIDYTLFDTANSSRIYFNNSILDVAGLKSANECQHCPAETNPLFISPSDYHLQALSPAHNSGNIEQVYTDFFNLYGIDIRRDLDNVFRPQGSAWDMGAYEYQESGSMVIRADVDNNSQINTTDAMLTLRNSLGLDMSGTNWQSSLTTGDVNCDGNSNSTDAMLILRYSLGLNMSGTGWCI